MNNRIFVLPSGATVILQGVTAKAFKELQEMKEFYESADKSKLIARSLPIQGHVTLRKALLAAGVEGFWIRRLYGLAYSPLTDVMIEQGVTLDKALECLAVVKHLRSNMILQKTHETSGYAHSWLRRLRDEMAKFGKDFNDKELVEYMQSISNSCPTWEEMSEKMKAYLEKENADT